MAPPTFPGWSLVIHGGSGQMRAETLAPAEAEAFRASLAATLAAAAGGLAAGGTALDAVEAAVRALEDDPGFNAGRGAVFTADGRIELDAAIMDGAARAAGAVAGVKRTRNPVSLARAVMAHSPHVLLAGDGADRFALEHGLESAGPDWFATPARWDALQQMRAALARGESGFDAELKFGTVGAVALDRAGRLAAATSTGGLTGKRWSRIGDSPLIGAGTWADAAIAVSATGSGEHFIRVGAAHEISARVRLAGQAAQAACDAVIAEITGLGGTGGVIFASADGSLGWSFSTPGMFRAAMSDRQKPQVAIFGDEG